MVLPATSEPTEPRQVVLPAEDLYWCVVDSRSLPRSVRSVRDIKRSKEALDALFEEELPCV